MIKTKIKRRYFVLIHVILIFFLCFLLLIIYSNKTSKKISLIASKYYERQMDIRLNSLLKKLTKDISSDILIIHKNSDGEIISADYDLKKSYELVDKVTNKLSSDIHNNLLKDIDVELPFFISSKNVFLNSYGPKIVVKMYYMDTMLVNIKTKITNYGFNNALAEAYIIITLDGQLLTPFESRKEKTKYELLISSKLINGRVPQLYGKSLTVSSVTFDIPIAN